MSDCMRTVGGVRAGTESGSVQSSAPSFVIEKGVPFSSQRSKLSHEIWLAMNACDVGDSFWIDMTGNKRSTIGVLVSRHAASMGRKYSVRTQGDGVRVWRTK